MCSVNPAPAPAADHPAPAAAVADQPPQKKAKGRLRPRGWMFTWQLDEERAYDYGVVQVNVGYMGEVTVTCDEEELRRYDIDFCKVAVEVGDSGNLHCQVYVHGRIDLTVACIRECFHWGAEHFHMEPAKHNRASARYCGDDDKDGIICDVHLFGTLKEHYIGQGARNDLSVVYDMLKDGYSVRDTAMTYPETFMKFHGGVSKMHCLINMGKPRKYLPQMILISGATGSGKSRLAQALFYSSVGTPPFVYSAALGKNFPWEGLTSETRVVIFDDWFNHMLDLDELLSMLSTTAMCVRVKNGTMPLSAYIFIFTTSTVTDLRTQYNGHSKHADWCRRVDEYSVEDPAFHCIAGK